jgi:predicted transcriptional regulator
VHRILVTNRDGQHVGMITSFDLMRAIAAD